MFAGPAEDRTRRDGDEAMRGDLGEMEPRARPAGGAAAVTPDEYPELALAERGKGGRTIDDVIGKGRSDELFGRVRARARRVRHCRVGGALRGDLAGEITVCLIADLPRCRRGHDQRCCDQPPDCLLPQAHLTLLDFRCDAVGYCCDRAIASACIACYKIVIEHYQNCSNKIAGRSETEISARRTWRGKHDPVSSSPPRRPGFAGRA